MWRVNLRNLVKESRNPVLVGARRAREAAMRWSLPGPASMWGPIWEGGRVSRMVYLRAKGALWVTPAYRGMCRSVGRNLVAGGHLPFVGGRGDIFIGDDVSFYGRADFFFGAVLKERPSLHIGDGCGVGHNVTFSVSGRLVIGEHTLIASNVDIRDCGGHPIDPAARRAGLAPTPDQVREVRIGSNVWIGTGAQIMPGAQIGDDCVIAPLSSISGRIPAGHLVHPAGVSAVPLRDLSALFARRSEGNRLHQQS